jgi:branched-chain amino acid transport system substrate-binding protein
VRSLIKYSAPVVVAALALSGCGTKGGDTASGGSTSGTKCDLQIGFFGALTGDAANLGINIKNGADLAVKQYNEKHKDCQVKLKQFDSQGSETQAPALAKTAIDDKTVIGIVGPAFSGESKAADPAFNEAGLTTITPSATNPALAKNGWKTFFRALGNDASQGPAAAKYIKEDLKATKVFVMTTPRSTARAWPTSSSPTSVRWSSAPTACSRSRPTSPPPSPRSRPPARRRSSTVATTPRPACW